MLKPKNGTGQEDALFFRHHITQLIGGQHLKSLATDGGGCLKRNFSATFRVDRGDTQTVANALRFDKDFFGHEAARVIRACPASDVAYN